MLNAKQDIEYKALIVDDELDICYLLSSILKQKHIGTTYANNLDQARRVIQQECPAVLFLDNNLPDGKGVEFIRQVKRISPGTKVIMITAYDTFSDRSRAYHEGADYFIGKPFTRDLISKALDQLQPVSS